MRRAGRAATGAGKLSLSCHISCHSCHCSHRGSGAGLAGLEIRVTEAAPRQTRDTDRCFRVVFLGGREVGKTSIMDQFMSSEHADVYENNNEEGEDSHDNKERSVLI